jgi:glycosyltransferase involved in cell wall biosynthesis
MMISKNFFILPVYIKKNDVDKLSFFSQTLDSIINQSEDDWNLIIIDDNSNNPDIYDIIENKFQEDKSKFVYLRNGYNCGPGISRNIGIEFANNMKANIILFQDADDIANSRRIEKTKEIFAKTDADLVYSPFIPIDENGKEIEQRFLAPSIRNIITANNENILIGKEVWKKIATETGYINLTSATSVKIEYAYKIKFPGYRVSEDAYTWMLYSAYGANFYFTDEIPCKYRIPQSASGSSSRAYIGKKKFYYDLARTDEEALLKCIQIVEQKSKINEDEKAFLKKSFYQRLNNMLKEENIF